LFLGLKDAENNLYKFKWYDDFDFVFILMNGLLKYGKFSNLLMTLLVTLFYDDEKIVNKF